MFRHAPRRTTKLCLSGDLATAAQDQRKMSHDASSVLLQVNNVHDTCNCVETHRRPKKVVDATVTFPTSGHHRRGRIITNTSLLQNVCQSSHLSQRYMLPERKQVSRSTVYSKMTNVTASMKSRPDITTRCLWAKCQHLSMTPAAHVR